MRGWPVVGGSYACDTLPSHHSKTGRKPVQGSTLRSRHDADVGHVRLDGCNRCPLAQLAWRSATLGHWRSGEPAEARSMVPERGRGKDEGSTGSSHPSHKRAEHRGGGQAVRSRSFLSRTILGALKSIVAICLFVAHLSDHNNIKRRGGGDAGTMQ